MLQIHLQLEEFEKNIRPETVSDGIKRMSGVIRGQSMVRLPIDIFVTDAIVHEELLELVKELGRLLIRDRSVGRMDWYNVDLISVEARHD